MTREEHLDWCKERALEYVERGDLTGAFTSIIKDLKEHEETKNHDGIKLGAELKESGYLTTTGEMRMFIEGFN